MILQHKKEDIHRKSGVYLIEYNLHKYVGSSIDLYSRFKHHLNSLKRGAHYNDFLQKIYNSYSDSITFSVIEFCENYIEREAFYIETLNPYINHILDPQSLVRDDVYRKRISESRKKAYANGLKPHNLKAVHKYSLDKGEYLESFESLTAAAKSINAKSINSIKAVCNGKQTSAGGYIWSYNKVSLVFSKDKKYKLQPVLQYTIDDIFIKKWESITEASKELGISNINRAISKNLTAGGYRWKKA